MSALGPEEQQIVDLVARWVDDEVRPVVNELEHGNTYPEKLIEQMKQMGVYGLAIPEPYGDFAVSAALLRAGDGGDRTWLDVAGGRLRRSLGRVEADPALRHRRAAAALPAADGDRRAAGDDGADRARRRVRPAGDAHRRATGRRRVRHQRLEDVDHQRPHVGAGRAAVQDRPRRAACAHRDLDPARREGARGSRCRAICRSSGTRASSRASCTSTTATSPPTPCSAASRARASAR